MCDGCDRRFLDISGNAKAEQKPIEVIKPIEKKLAAKPKKLPKKIIKPIERKTAVVKAKKSLSKAKKQVKEKRKKIIHRQPVEVKKVFPLVEEEKKMYECVMKQFEKRKIELVNKGTPASSLYKPTVSIAMTVYNTGKFFKKALKCLVRQDYPDWELCIVDDFSTDNSMQEVNKQIDSFSVRHKTRIRQHLANCGYGRSLKDAIEMGTGELVAVIDSDDALSRNDALSLMVEAHRLYSDCALVYSTYWACHNKMLKNIIKKIVPLEDGKNILDYMLTGTLKKYRASHLKVFKRAAYDDTDGLDPTLVKTVDKDLVLRLEESRFKDNHYIGSLVFIDIPLYYHRKHPASLTESYGKRGIEYIRKVQRDKARIIRNAKKRRGIPLNEKDIAREEKMVAENGQ